MYVFMSQVKQPILVFFVSFFLIKVSLAVVVFLLSRPATAAWIEETLLPSFYSFVLWLKLVLHSETLVTMVSLYLMQP